MSTDQKIRQNTPWRLASASYAALRISRIRTSRYAPDFFIHGPVDINSSIREEDIQGCFIFQWTGHQLGKNRPGNHKFLLRDQVVEDGTCYCIQRVVIVP